MNLRSVMLILLLALSFACVSHADEGNTCEGIIGPWKGIAKQYGCPMDARVKFTTDQSLFRIDFVFVEQTPHTCNAEKIVGHITGTCHLGLLTFDTMKGAIFDNSIVLTDASHSLSLNLERE